MCAPVLLPGSEVLKGEGVLGGMFGGVGWEGVCLGVLGVAGGIVMTIT